VGGNGLQAGRDELGNIEKMKYSEGTIGRIVVVRLEDGDRLPDCIEELAVDRGITHAVCVLVGGADDGSKLVVGPEDGRTLPPVPVIRSVQGVHEIMGVGTLMPDDSGTPILHMHAALGRQGHTTAGCVRPGVHVWKLGEVIIIEITGNAARRVTDSLTGFTVLEP